ncbi:MAG: transporter suffix domain-containing protein [Gammaproteobacteria bacterium]
MNLTPRQFSGYALIAFSFVMWGGVLLIPFVEMSTGQAAAVAAMLIVGGEVIYVLGLFLVGRQMWEKVKDLLRKAWQSPDQDGQ